MNQKLTKFFNIIKKDKHIKKIIIVVLLILFIFTIGYSLSIFTGVKSTTLANIKVNNLIFNMTTNSGESDDRILHLKAGKIEQFKIILTNLNKVNVKYELIYELCNDSNCTSTSKNIPSDIKVGKAELKTEINGLLDKNSKTIVIETQNLSDKDYYIKLNINAGYEWNELELANQIGSGFEKGSLTQIVAYVDGVETSTFPTSCNYIAEIKGYNGDEEVELEDAKASCDFQTKKWSVYYSGSISKIILNLNFSPGLVPGTFSDDSWTKIAEVVRNGQGMAYPVGSEKNVLIDNTYYTVRVANNTTPNECNQEGFSQTACGFVVEFVDIVEKRVMNSTKTNVGGWPASTMRTYANNDFLNKLPSDLKNAIIETKVVSSHGNKSGESNFVSYDKIYLLGGHEIFKAEKNSILPTNDTTYNQTRQLDYYESNGVTTSYSSMAKKKYNNSNANWWLRTSVSGSNTAFIYASSSENWNSADANSSYGFAPAFRIG